MTCRTVEYIEGANLGDVVVSWLDTNGALRDFETGWTFEVVVYPWNGLSRSFAKVTGITGDDEAPNLTVVWAVDDEVKTLTAGVYKIEFSAENGDGKVTKMQGVIRVIRGAPAA